MHRFLQHHATTCSAVPTYKNNTASAHLALFASHLVWYTIPPLHRPPACHHPRQCQSSTRTPPLPHRRLLSLATSPGRFFCHLCSSTGLGSHWQQSAESYAVFHTPFASCSCAHTHTHTLALSHLALIVSAFSIKPTASVLPQEFQVQLALGAVPHNRGRSIQPCCGQKAVSWLSSFDGAMANGPPPSGRKASVAIGDNVRG